MPRRYIRAKAHESEADTDGVRSGCGESMGTRVAVARRKDSELGASRSRVMG